MNAGILVRMPADVLLVSACAQLTSALGEQMAHQDQFNFFSAQTFAEADRIFPQPLSPNLVLIGYVRHSSDVLHARSAVEERHWISRILAFCREGDPFVETEADLIRAPFRFPVFSRRLISILTSASQNRQSVWNISECQYAPSEKQLVNASGAMFKLTEKEASILSCLYLAEGRPVSREKLLRDLWGYHSDAETHTVETHIYRLRQKLERDPSQAKVLVTDATGYRLLR